MEILGFGFFFPAGCCCTNLLFMRINTKSKRGQISCGGGTILWSFLGSDIVATAIKFKFPCQNCLWELRVHLPICAVPSGYLNFQPCKLLQMQLIKQKIFHLKKSSAHP